MGRARSHRRGGEGGLRGAPWRKDRCRGGAGGDDAAMRRRSASAPATKVTGCDHGGIGLASGPPPGTTCDLPDLDSGAVWLQPRGARTLSGDASDSQKEAFQRVTSRSSARKARGRCSSVSTQRSQTELQRYSARVRGQQRRRGRGDGRVHLLQEAAVLRIHVVLSDHRDDAGEGKPDGSVHALRRRVASEEEKASRRPGTGRIGLATAIELGHEQTPDAPPSVALGHDHPSPHAVPVENVARAHPAVVDDDRGHAQKRPVSATKRSQRPERLASGRPGDREVLHVHPRERALKTVGRLAAVALRIEGVAVVFNNPRTRRCQAGIRREVDVAAVTSRCRWGCHDCDPSQG